MQNKKDIVNETDIKLLVDSFYNKVLRNPVIGFIFTEVAQLSLEKHMPVMYAFWGSILLGSQTYTGNPMAKHFELDNKTTLTAQHFAEWLLLWESTVNELFAGEKANEAIARAKNIAAVMQYQIQQQRNAKG
jgi:hemoglobin